MRPKERDLTAPFLSNLLLSNLLLSNPFLARASAGGDNSRS